ncbi:MAG TPA: DUF1799 domain-containing protein [Accumulibacter sp.]|uniref:DUF1799 domain-containing protein n=1 Tax=Accumulibacter sp. TaxID=2053492 RepID=UPI002C5F0997|nr:DUF1799 domain-containing protein [Accumulibacter sp.]HRD90963.1 DUF1799 domain-containing protein [Accumulibacter sp.]
MGFEPGDFDDGEGCEVWPEHWQAVEVFAALQTQWAVGGMGGVIGLRYEVLPTVCDLLGVKKRRRRELFDALRLMESAALEVLTKRSGG